MTIIQTDRDGGAETCVDPAQTCERLARYFDTTPEDILTRFKAGEVIDTCFARYRPYSPMPTG